MDVARVDPSTIDAGAIGFRLGPRLNAAGRLLPRRRRPGAAADRGPRARPRGRRSSSTPTTPSAATSRRGSASRPRRRSPSRAPPPPTCSPSDGWHAGRDRHRRRADRRAPPPPVRADRARRRGGHGLRAARSRRFDLLGGLHAGLGDPAALRRPPRRRGPDDRRAPTSPAFREAFAAHAASVLAPEDLRPEVRVDAVAPGDALTLSLAEELEQLAPFGQGNPAGLAARPRRAARRPAADGGGPPRRVHARRRRRPLALRAVRRRHAACPPSPASRSSAVVRLERNHWNGTTEPRLILRHAHRAPQRPID